MFIVLCNLGLAFLGEHSMCGQYVCVCFLLLSFAELCYVLECYAREPYIYSLVEGGVVPSVVFLSSGALCVGPELTIVLRLGPHATRVGCCCCCCCHVEKLHGFLNDRSNTQRLKIKSRDG